jgi:hypothetical protein
MTKKILLGAGLSTSACREISVGVFILFKETKTKHLFIF